MFCPVALAPWWDQDLLLTNYASSLSDHLSGVSNLGLVDFEPTTPQSPIFKWSANAPVYSSPVSQYIATNSLEKALAGVAASLSNLSLAANTTVPVLGNALINKTFVQTAWYWLISPFALDVAGLLFLLLAIWQSRRKKVKPWKSSIFPLLCHGLEPGMLTQPPVSEDVSAMEAVAGNAKVRLAFSNRGGKSMLKQT